jgi:hypothetical protein
MSDSLNCAIAGDFRLAAASQIDALRAGGLDVRR